MLDRERPAEGFYDWIVFEPFKRNHLGTLAEDRIGDTRTCRRSVDQNRTGPAHALLAAYMRRREVKSFAKEIGKMSPGFDKFLETLAIDKEVYLHHESKTSAAARCRAVI